MQSSSIILQLLNSQRNVHIITFYIFNYMFLLRRFHLYILKMEKDLEESIQLLKDVRGKCEDVVNHVNHLCKKAMEGEFKTSKVNIIAVKMCPGL